MIEPAAYVHRVDQEAGASGRSSDEPKGGLPAEVLALAGDEQEPFALLRPSADWTRLPQSWSVYCLTQSLLMLISPDIQNARPNI